MKQREASIRILHNGIVAPLTNLQPRKDGRPGQFDGGVYNSEFKPVFEGLQEKQGYENIPATLNGGDAMPEMTGRHLFGGMLQTTHFGHFMVESIVRLWALDIVEPPDALVFYSRIPGRSLPSYAKQLFQLLGFEGDITLVDQPTRFTEMLVPSPIARSAWVWGYEPNRKIFQKLRDIPASPHRKVYVSRSRLNGNDGAILFEDRIEQELSRAGYTIIHPQEISICQQLSIYNGAEEIIFSEGSALHLYALVARSDQKVFVVWRRRPGNFFSAQVQSFGGSALSGIGSVRELWVPAFAPTATANARAVLDFNHLFSELDSLGFIDGWSSAELPTRESIDMKFSEIKEQSGKAFVPYQGAI